MDRKFYGYSNIHNLDLYSSPGEIGKHGSFRNYCESIKGSSPLESKLLNLTK